MPEPTLQELQAQFLSAKANLAAIKAQQAQDNATLDPKSQAEALLLHFKAKIAAIDASCAAQAAAQPEPTPSPRRRRFKSITQVRLPNNNGDIYRVFLAICEEGRAWRKDPDTDKWVEVTSLPDI